VSANSFSVLKDNHESASRNSDDTFPAVVTQRSNKREDIFRITGTRHNVVVAFGGYGKPFRLRKREYFPYCHRFEQGRAQISAFTLKCI
jgi:hypothetical protein